MITELTVRNFKIHQALDLPMRNLTVLAGYNSAGKSSVIQALLLLRQNKLEGNLSKNLNLKGNLCQVGVCKNAVCLYSGETVSLGFKNENKQVLWHFDMSIGAAEKSFASCTGVEGDADIEENIFGNEFQYISVARWAPSESYPFDSKAIEEQKQLSQKYGQCELIPHFLYRYGVEKPISVAQELWSDGCEDANLLKQVSAWEQKISQSVNVKPHPVGTSFQLDYTYDTPSGESEPYPAINVGSGISFVLPVITALLCTGKGGMVIIENPEAHLHPQGQAELAKLIVRAARFGVQVIVETHSDYILNGILIACRNFLKGNDASGINPTDVAIYQFIKHEDSQLSEAIPVTLGESGNMTNQPEGFFDQMEKDMNTILNLD